MRRSSAPAFCASGGFAFRPPSRTSPHAGQTLSAEKEDSFLFYSVIYLGYARFLWYNKFYGQSVSRLYDPRFPRRSADRCCPKAVSAPEEVLSHRANHILNCAVFTGTSYFVCLYLLYLFLQVYIKRLFNKDQGLPFCK